MSLVVVRVPLHAIPLLKMADSRAQVSLGYGGDDRLRAQAYSANARGGSLGVRENGHVSSRARF